MNSTQGAAPAFLGSRRAVALAVALAAIVLVCLGARSAQADEGITKFEMSTTTTQAGGHPDITFSYQWKDRFDAPSDPCHCDDMKFLTTDTPTGFVGNPHAVPTCTLDAFSLGECPEESQVGVFTWPLEPFEKRPVYNMVTRPDQAGLIAFEVTPYPFEAPVFIDIAARTESDYGLQTTAGPIYHLFFFFREMELELWGVPADSSHDPQRFNTPLGPLPFFYTKGASSNAPLRPYLQNPTTCGTPLAAGVTGEYYTGNTYRAEVPYPSTTGCDSLSFNPSLTAQPTTTQADTPSGLDVNLKVPQTLSATTPTPSQIRSATVKLPLGYTINANAADGKIACSDFDSAIGRSRGPATCPEFSKIGTARIDSSALPGPLDGAVYLGEPTPANRYRVILTGDGFGTHIKIGGTIVPDPQSGQLTIQLTDLPQSPLTEFDMHIFGSERGNLATPTQCGSYPVESTFVPWDSSLPTQTSKSFFEITSGPNGTPCPTAPRKFEPAFEGGSRNATAGMSTPFDLRVSRSDGDQDLSGIDLHTPPGFAASLRGIPYCPQSAIDQLESSDYSGAAELTSPACPTASQIGTAVAGAGAGSKPLHINGKVYLAGPYKGAPVSVLVVAPAVSGPYDLGVVAVRAAVFVDPITAEVSALSDPLPQIVGGIPLRTRLIDLSLDRPNFTFNPTNCDPFAIRAGLLGDEGGIAQRSERFQVANCADLPFEPKLSIALRGALNRRGHPSIHAVLTPAAGEANTKSASVILPRGSLLDNGHINTICTRVDFAARSCPAGSAYGAAEASTPVLDNPLAGTVYLRSSSHKLPDLVVDLRGQIDVVLVGKIDSVKGRLRVTFQSVPDVPVSQFVLDLKGGRKGLLQNSEGVCENRKRATVRMVGQNGVRSTFKPMVEASCGSGNAKRKRQASAVNRSRVVR